MCDDCLYYEWEEVTVETVESLCCFESSSNESEKYMSKVELQVRQLMPEDLPLVDDNSDFTLMGYQNFLIEPRVGTSSTSSLQLISILLENADLFYSNPT